MVSRTILILFCMLMVILLGYAVQSRHTTSKQKSINVVKETESTLIDRQLDETGIGNPETLRIIKNQRRQGDTIKKFANIIKENGALLIKEKAKNIQIKESQKILKIKYTGIDEVQSIRINDKDTVTIAMPAKISRSYKHIKVSRKMKRKPKNQMKEKLALATEVGIAKNEEIKAMAHDATEEGHLGNITRSDIKADNRRQGGRPQGLPVLNLNDFTTKPTTTKKLRFNPDGSKVRDQEFHPHRGYEPYWQHGGYMFHPTRRPVAQGGSRPVCGFSECPLIYIRYGKICAQNMNFKEQTFQNYCEMIRNDCQNRIWSIAYRGECVPRFGVSVLRGICTRKVPFTVLPTFPRNYQNQNNVVGRFVNEWNRKGYTTRVTLRPRSTLPPEYEQMIQEILRDIPG